jgi:hypothetical protein
MEINGTGEIQTQPSSRIIFSPRLRARELLEVYWVSEIVQEPIPRG